MKHLSIGHLVSQGWEAMKKRFGFFLGLLVTAFLITAVPSLLAQFLENRDHPALSALLGVLHFILATLVSIGLIYIAIKVARGEEPVFPDLFAKSGLFFKFLGAEILYGLIVLAGLILFIIPGIYWGVRYGMFSYFVVDKNLGPIEALKASAKLTEGAKWDLLGLWIVLGLINLLGVLFFGIGLLVTYPTTLVAGALAYLKLLSPSDTEERNIV